MENNDKVILPRLEEETFCVNDTNDNDYNKKSWQDQVKNIFDYAKLKYH